MTPEMQKRIKDAARSFEKYNSGNSREDQEDAFIEGAKFGLEMLEQQNQKLKQALAVAVEGLERIELGKHILPNGEVLTMGSYQMTQTAHQALEKIKGIEREEKDNL